MLIPSINQRRYVMVQNKTRSVTYRFEIVSNCVAQITIECTSLSQELLYQEIIS